MRPIKFRGKATMTKVELDYQNIPNFNGWVKGSLITDGDIRYIVGRIVEASDVGLIHEWWVKVHPESVGQDMGLKDKNGREIYEGDIVRDSADFLMQIKHEEFTYSLIDDTEKEWLLPFVGFYAEGIPDGIIDDTSVIGASELVGNIYEHPHLVESESNQNP